MPYFGNMASLVNGYRLCSNLCYWTRPILRRLDEKCSFEIQTVCELLISVLRLAEEKKLCSLYSDRRPHQKYNCFCSRCIGHRLVAAMHKTVELALRVSCHLNMKMHDVLKTRRKFSQSLHSGISTCVKPYGLFS